MFMFEILQLLRETVDYSHSELFCCCYWDGIVRNFLYFFCRQLTKVAFFWPTVGAWLPTKTLYAQPACQAPFAALISI